MTPKNAVLISQVTAPVALGSTLPPADAALPPAPDWSIYGLTMVFSELQEVTHDSDSGLHARIKSDPDFPRGFPLSDAPRARKIWWTHEIKAWFELRSAKSKAMTAANPAMLSTKSMPSNGDDVDVVATRPAVGAKALDAKHAPRRRGNANSVNERLAVRAQRSEG